MKNPILDEKTRVQKELSQKAGSIQKYLEMAKLATLEAEKEHGVTFNRETSGRKAV